MPLFPFLGISDSSHSTKNRLSEEATVEDVEEAVRLVEVALASSATDKETGLIDIDLLATGQSSMERQRKKDASKTLLSLLQRMWGDGQTVKYTTVAHKFIEESQERITEDFFRDLLSSLESDGKCTL